MRDIWVVSDTHFGHSNIIGYCNRPFANYEEMNEKMIENWNNTVKDGDIIYHLGDVYFGKQNSSNFNHRLKGRKRLILGNHDTGKDPILTGMFEKILVWRMFPEFKLLLTHVPVHISALGFKTEKNVHGHVHQNSIPDEHYINVSVEMTNYTPVNIESLRVA